jgi:hypothetical protein
MWKAGDFFDIRELVVEAEKALTNRLAGSAEFFDFNPEPKRNRHKNADCKGMSVRYGVCGHFEREYRSCGVRTAHPQTVFHLCEPQGTRYLDGRLCDTCFENKLRPFDIAAERDESPSRHQNPDRPTPPDDESRALIEHEIQALCEALVVATRDTPQGSRMQKALIDHMCNTRVAAWDGFTVCRFLEW